jgi:hypothetical protein
VEHRAVAGKLIVLVEHVQVEGAVVVPVVHRLKGDQGQLVVDGDLGELLVLHAVGPAPQDLPEAQLGDVAEHRLGLQDDVALGNQLLVGPDAGDPALELVVGEAEAVPVASFEVDALAQVSGNPSEVLGMEWKAALVLFERPGHDAKAQLVHASPSFGPSVERKAHVQVFWRVLVAVGSESWVELYVTLLGWRTVLPPG